MNKSICFLVLLLTVVLTLTCVRVEAARILHTEEHDSEALSQTQQDISDEDSTSESNSNDESSSNNNNQGLQGLAGMGITVVLRNRNHIRTIQDKSARLAVHEAHNKQASAEQLRKDRRRAEAEKEARRRQEREQLEEKADSDKRESASKARTEAALKQATKEAQERQDKIEEAARREQEKRDAETRRREQQQEESDKARAKERQKRDEQNKKKDENREKGTIRIAAFKPSQGRILRDASKVPFTGAYTYMFWIRPLGRISSWANIMHKGQANVNRNPAVWFYPGQTRLHIRSGNTANPNWSNGGNHGCDPAAHLTIGEWTHVAFTHSSSGIKVFYNGNVVCTTNYGGPAANSGPMYVSDPWHHPGNCYLADFRFLAREATADEIEKAFAAKRGLN